ncbi:MAG: prolipoprotein diacylglyceryl transferase [Bacteroidaceae bacterium]|nr:prolipoprotein diacylglyceryl transferase [Bacteroidaceae bacterium]
MFHFQFITWNPDIVALDLGFIAIRWYSLCWAIGLVSVFLLMHKLYRQQKISEEQFDPMFMYCFLGILIGARLGHCLFYEPGYYLSHPIEMLLPFRNVPGKGWTFTGYEGLASHGGTLGLMIALWLYAKHVKLRFLHVLDNVAIVTPICACAIRLGNLMNSEIIGRPTDLPWAFIFERVDMLPRHPGQLYEAICYAIFFGIHWFFYRRYPQKVGSGFFFGLCLFLIFTSRIFIEYTKENQEAFEEGMLLNMGQLLSIPFVVLGLYWMFRSSSAAEKTNHSSKD